MENVGGTEVISGALEVLFVAGHLLDDLLHCNSCSCWRAAGRMGDPPSLALDGRLARGRRKTCP